MQNHIDAGRYPIYWQKKLFFCSLLQTNKDSYKTKQILTIELNIDYSIICNDSFLTMSLLLASSQRTFKIINLSLET